MGSSCKVAVLYPPDLDRDFDTHLATLGFGVNPASLHREYRQQALRLNTLSDLDLRQLGVRRCDIPAYVMRHQFPVFAQQFSIWAARS